MAIVTLPGSAEAAAMADRPADRTNAIGPGPTPPAADVVTEDRHRHTGRSDYPARRAGVLALLLALLATITSYLLQTTLGFPAILVDRASSGAALVASGTPLALLAFGGLLICGLVLTRLSMALTPAAGAWRRMQLTGYSAGAGWVAGGPLGWLLVALWRSGDTVVAQALAAIALLLTQVAVPLFLAVWTSTVARRLHVHPALGLVSALGLGLIVLRSLVWLLNARLPVASGFYATAGLLAIFALVGESLWLVWLFCFGFRLLRGPDQRM